jgi:hypothetical protein
VLLDSNIGTMIRRRSQRRPPMARPRTRGFREPLRDVCWDGPAPKLEPMLAVIYEILFAGFFGWLMEHRWARITLVCLAIVGGIVTIVIVVQALT